MSGGKVEEEEEEGELVQKKKTNFTTEIHPFLNFIRALSFSSSLRRWRL